VTYGALFLTEGLVVDRVLTRCKSTSTWWLRSIAYFAFLAWPRLDPHQTNFRDAAALAPDNSGGISAAKLPAVLETRPRPDILDLGG
jgi:hypothetical protein